MTSNNGLSALRPYFEAACFGAGDPVTLRELGDAPGFFESSDSTTETILALGETDSGLREHISFDSGLTFYSLQKPVFHGNVLTASVPAAVPALREMRLNFLGVGRHEDRLYMGASALLSSASGLAETTFEYFVPMSPSQARHLYRTALVWARSDFTWPTNGATQSPAQTDVFRVASSLRLAASLIPDESSERKLLAKAFLFRKAAELYNESGAAVADRIPLAADSYEIAIEIFERLGDFGDQVREAQARFDALYRVV